MMSKEQVESDEERPLSPGESITNLEETKRGFQERVATYRPVNLIESERKRKRGLRLDPPVRSGELEREDSQTQKKTQPPSKARD